MLSTQYGSPGMDDGSGGDYGGYDNAAGQDPQAPYTLPKSVAGMCEFCCFLESAIFSPLTRISECTAHHGTICCASQDGGFLNGKRSVCQWCCRPVAHLANLVGLYESGIFRESGDPNAVKVLKMQLDAGKGMSMMHIL